MAVNDPYINAVQLQCCFTLMKLENNVDIQYLTPALKYLKTGMMCKPLHHIGNTAGLTGHSDFMQTME